MLFILHFVNDLYFTLSKLRIFKSFDKDSAFSKKTKKGIDTQPLFIVLIFKNLFLSFIQPCYLTLCQSNVVHFKLVHSAFKIVIPVFRCPTIPV